MHEPVLLRETVEMLRVKLGGVYIDGTLGGGGHAFAILESLGPDGVLLGMDRDAGAVERCRARLEGFEARTVIKQANFEVLADMAREEGLGQADGVVLDLGLSSDQLADGERGFSFQNDGPLDMRMDATEETPTAEELVNDMSEHELGDTIWKFGEERMSRRIARAIVRARESARITRTGRLADIVAAAVGRRGRMHPATRTFQALRMAVNRELDCLAEALRQGIELLAPHGRMAVISFHSLEDRAVKHCFARHVGRWESLPEGGEAWRGEKPALSWVARKPVRPSGAEVEANPRARSAKLRVVERDEGSRDSRSAHSGESR